MMSDENIDQTTESVEDIDEKRLHRKAYEYLCRLLEVRNWLSECLQDDSISSVTELEENFRNGVVLARLGNSFAPNVVTVKSIYDINQEKYVQNENIPVYRHTDNIMLWRKAMQSVRLPEIVIPETVDVFEGRNIQTIFCLYALATLLYRLRKAPPIRNLAGKAVFTQSELDEMKVKVNESNMPEFGDVHDFLSNMTTDEKATAIAIQKINNEIDNQNSDDLLNALQDADAGILHVEKDLRQHYLMKLTEEKANQANSLLPKDAIQNIIVQTNNNFALNEVNELLADLNSIDSKKLLYLLDILQFEQIREFAIPLYLSSLSEQKKAKNGNLTRDEVIETLRIANALAEVKLAVQQGSSTDVFNTLKNPCLELKLKEENTKLYYNRLLYSYEKCAPEFFLSKKELQDIIYEFEDLSTEHRSIMELKGYVGRNDGEAAQDIIKLLSANDYEEENIEYYLNYFQSHMPNSVDDVMAALKHVNSATLDAFARGDNVLRLNKAMQQHDSSNTRLHLQALVSSTDCNNFRHELMHWYIKRLLTEGTTRNELKKDLPHQEMWLCEHFMYGSVYIETTEHVKKTVRREPLDPSTVTWPEIKTMIDEENNDFDNHYASNEDKVKKSQDTIRQYLENKKKKEELQQKRKEDEAAKKIQNNYKKYKDRKDHNQLKSIDNPSFELVRKFVGALHQQENELEHDLELEQFKSRVWHLRVANQQLDDSLRDLDNKIGLLVKNRLNLQDVIDSKNKISDANDQFKQRPASIRKKAKDQQEGLEQLLYHLQADANYLANLVQSEERRSIAGTDLINDCIAPIFGFITEKREEFLLIRLLCEILMRTVEKLNTPGDLAKSKNMDFIKNVLLSNMFDVADRDPCTVLKSHLQEFVKSGENLVFNLDPQSIYPGSDKDDIEVMLANAQVKKVLDDSISFLSKWSEIIVDEIIQEYKLPNCVIYLAAYLDDILFRHFPTASRVDLTRTVSEFVFENYFHSFLVSRRAVFRAAGIELKDSSCSLLEAVVQFIDYGIKNRGYGNSKYFLSILNKDIHIINEKFLNYINKQVREVNLEDIYGLNELTHFDPAHKPTLSLTEKQLTIILKFLKLNAPVIVPGTGMQLHNLLANCSAPDRSSDEKTVWLQLHPMKDISSERSAMQELFIRTKKIIVDLLLSGVNGTTIPQLLDAEPTEENIRLHNDFYNSEKCSIKEKQQQVRENLVELEKMNRSKSSDDYQTIVTEIANDIRLATRRRKERAELRSNLTATEIKLVKLRHELDQKLEHYEEYLETCLDNLSRTSKRMSFRPDTKTAGKIQKERHSLCLLSTYRVTMEKLIRKKIVITFNVSNYQKKISKLNVDFNTTSKKGIFQVVILDNKTVINSLQLDFQDLLQREAVQAHIYIDDILEFDIINLKNFINRKFYSK